MQARCAKPYRIWSAEVGNSKDDNIAGLYVLGTETRERLIAFCQFNDLFVCLITHNSNSQSDAFILYIDITKQSVQKLIYSIISARRQKSLGVCVYLFIYIFNATIIINDFICVTLNMYLNFTML